MSGSDKGGGVSHHTPPSDKARGDDPRKPRGLPKVEDSIYGRVNVVEGQLDFGFGRINPNVPGAGWLLFDAQSQLWQGLTIGAVPTGRYTHIESCVAALHRLRAIELEPARHEPAVAPAPPAADRAESAPAPTGSRRANR